MAGLVDRAPYHINYPDYTGEIIGSNPPPDDPVDPPTDPLDPPIDPVDPPVDPPTDPVDDPGDPPTDPVDPPDDPITSDYEVDFAITNNWGSGYQGEGKITNNDTSPLNGWTIEFEFSGNITQIWDAEIVSQNGDTYVIRNAVYNGTISAGQEISFGFLGDGSISNVPEVFTLNGMIIGSNTDPDNPGDYGDDNHNGDGHNHDHGDEHNHNEDPLPNDDPKDPLTDEGQIFYSDGSNQPINDFDPSQDRVNIGPDSIHNQIPIDTANGLVFQNMFNPNRSLTLVGINLKDLKAENFTPISDAHLQQDLSAALAWENGTGYIRENTVYVRSHEQGLEEIVEFNPETDRISFFYLSVRGDNQLNFAVEQTAVGVRFYSPITGQSITLSGIEFSDLNSSHFEWRANQLEDNIAGRMGLSD